MFTRYQFIILKLSNRQLGSLLVLKVHAYNVYTLIPELPDCMNKLAKLIYNTALCFSLYLPLLSLFL